MQSELAYTNHLEVTIDPNAPLYSEPIGFIEQCQLLKEPIRQLKIAWGNKDSFPRILEILMRMNWYSQRLPLQPKGSFARPSGFMECSIKRAIHTLQILTTLSFYPRLPTIQKYQEIERVKLTATIAALLSSVGEPAVNYEVVSYDSNHQLIKRKNEYERLDNFLEEDVDSIHINFQDPPPKEFYSSIAIDLMHEIVPDDLMQDIAQAYDRNLRRFLQNFVGRHFIQAEVANHKLFNCLISADVITQDREFAYSGKRVDKTPLPHLQHEMEIVLAHKFKGDWAKEKGKAHFCRCVALWKGELWIRYPLGFEEIADLARQKWPFTEIPLNAQSLFSYCSYLGIVKQPPNSDLEERIFLEPREVGGRTKHEEISCPAVVLNEPFLYLEEDSVWAHELKECLPEKVWEAKIKKKPSVQDIIADTDKKKADITLSIRNKKESPLNTTSGSGSSVIAMANEFINLHAQKLEKEKNKMKGSPIEEAKKSANVTARKAIDKQHNTELNESLKAENLYPFNQEKPIEESHREVTNLENSISIEQKPSGWINIQKLVITFFKRLSGKEISPDDSKNEVELTSSEATKQENSVNAVENSLTEPSKEVLPKEEKTTCQKISEAIAEEKKSSNSTLAIDMPKMLALTKNNSDSTPKQKFATYTLANKIERPDPNTPNSDQKPEEKVDVNSKSTQEDKKDSTQIQAITETTVKKATTPAKRSRARSTKKTSTSASTTKAKTTKTSTKPKASTAKTTTKKQKATGGNKAAVSKDSSIKETKDVSTNQKKNSPAANKTLKAGTETKATELKTHQDSASSAALTDKASLATISKSSKAKPASSHQKESVSSMAETALKTE